MVPELCFGFIFLIIMLQNSTTAKQDEPVRGSKGTKLDATQDKYKHTQQALHEDLCAKASPPSALKHSQAVN